MIETAHAVSESAVLDALRDVIDPELDESLVELGFVDRVHVERGSVEVTLRLPTFWCAPNFAYLMAHDARLCVSAVPGVEEVRVVLKDHMYSDEISVGVSECRTFSETFPDQIESDDIEGLRQVFRRKAFGMRQEQLIRFLQEEGLTAAEIVALQVADVLDTSDRDGLRLRVNGAERVLRGGAPLARAYLERRQRVGLDTPPGLFTDVEERPIAASDLADHLAQTRRQRISMTFNALMCRGLLETRYDLKGGAQ